MEDKATPSASGQEVEVAANKTGKRAREAHGASGTEADRKEFADPATQPAARMEDLPAEYQRLLKDDLSIETLPPERRQIILNYFRNLRKAAASQQATTTP